MAPVISHHEAVRQLLGKNTPEPMIEITGARGKTTTAHALAFLMEGPGILHTSTGTYQLPGKEVAVTIEHYTGIGTRCCEDGMLHPWLADC